MSGTWIDVVGYQHEVVHTGVLKALLEDEMGAELAAELTGRPLGAVERVDPHKVVAEQRLERGAGKADLTAQLELADGTIRRVAVETKVHSNGTRDQLQRTTGDLPDAEGVLLALGLTSLKMSVADTDEVSQSGSTWHFVGPERWIRALEGQAEVKGSWLPEYVAAVKAWVDTLDGRGPKELEHLRWMNDVREGLEYPERWGGIETMISGPLLSCFGWEDEPKLHDVYLQFMGHWDGRRVLCLKAGVAAQAEAAEPEDLQALIARLEQQQSRFPDLSPGGRKGGRSRTILVSADLADNPAEAARIANRSVEALDDLFPQTK